MMPCSIVSWAFQPVDWIFFVSRKMKGLSPIQPLLPPVYSSLGVSPRALQMAAMLSLTCTYSGVPRL